MRATRENSFEPFSSHRIVAASGVVLLVFLSFAYGVGVGACHWPPFSLLKGIRTSTRVASWDKFAGGDAVAAEIAAIARSESGTSKARQAEFVRQFVYRNSVHQIDEEFRRYAWDRPRVLQMLSEHHRTQRSPPHLSCGSRAIAMRTILAALGIESRLVQTFSDDYEEVRSHTFLEVYDDETARWVVHDPDYDVTYVDALSNQPVSLIRLILGDLASVAPVSARGRGWELNKAGLLKKRFFEAARYEGREGTSDILVVNSDRFSITKRFPGNGQMTFLEFSEQHYRRPTVLLNNGVFWKGLRTAF
jgi:hypothetical protein